ncbi:MAG: hypothetical protein HDS59_09370 [Barnesiella sp.]|nr:hypothetical protein [Barnesiella sp.]
MDDLTDLLRKKMNSDDWFTTDLRVSLIWDDTKYLETIDLIKGIMNKYRNNFLIPKILIRFFTFDVDMITGITRNKLFFNVKSDKINDIDSYRKLVKCRIAELNELRDTFFAGEEGEELL